MSKVLINFIQIHKKGNQEKRISKFLSMNCAGWNPINWKLNWNWKIGGEVEWLQKFLIENPFKELSYLFHQDSNI